MIRVLKLAFSGAGTSYSKALSSRSFQERLKQEQNLELLYSMDTDQGRALEIGTTSFAAAISSGVNEQEALKVVTDKSVECRATRATIHALGDSIIEKAIDCLPDKALELASSWKEFSAKEQLEGIDNLCSLVRGFVSSEEQNTSDIQGFFQSLTNENSVDVQPSTPELPRWHSWLKEKNDHVLPARFGKVGKSKIRPNCLGMVELILAFARKANVKAYLGTQLISATEAIQLKRSEIAAKILPYVGSAGTNFSDAYSEFLKAEIRYGELIRTGRPYWHGVVFLQIKDGFWIQVDPHSLEKFGVVFEDQTEVCRIDALLQKYSEVLPGLNLLARFEQLNNAVENVSAEFAKIQNELWPIQAALAKEQVDIESLITILQDSPLLDKLMRRIGRTVTHNEEKFTLREKAIMVLAKCVREHGLQYLIDTDAWISYREEQGLSIEQSTLDCYLEKPEMITAIIGADLSNYGKNNVPVLDWVMKHLIMDDPQCFEVLRKIPACLLNSAMKDLSLVQTRENTTHPGIEIGLPEYQIGVAVLGHLASNDPQIACQVENVLASHSSGQFRSLSQVVSLDDLSSNAERHARILQSQPTVLPAAEYAVRIFNQRKGASNGQETSCQNDEKTDQPNRRGQNARRYTRECQRHERSRRLVSQGRS